MKDFIEIKKFLDYKNKFELKWLRLPNVKGSLEKFFNIIYAYIEDVNDIKAIIIFGSAIRKSKIISYQRKRFFIFGEEITIKKEIPYDPKDVDVLVITGKAYFDKKYILPRIDEGWDGSKCVSCFVHAGYDFMNRSVDQIEAGLKAYDTIAMNALREGVILAKADNFDIDQFGIINQNNMEIDIQDSNLKLSLAIG